MQTNFPTRHVGGIDHLFAASFLATGGGSSSLQRMRVDCCAHHNDLIALKGVRVLQARFSVGRVRLVAHGYATGHMQIVFSGLSKKRIHVWFCFCFRVSSLRRYGNSDLLVK